MSLNVSSSVRDVGAIRTSEVFDSIVFPYFEVDVLCFVQLVFDSEVFVVSYPFH